MVDQGQSDRRLHRVAWLGQIGDGGGVAGMGRVLMNGLLRRGIQVDYYTTSAKEEVPAEVRDDPNLTITGHDVGWKWRWGAWYSRNSFSSFVSGFALRSHNYNELCKLLIQSNRLRRYDVIFQLSQQELFYLGRNRAELPPIVIYPCSHAAGELRWHKKESAFALVHENRFVHMGVRAVLRYRSWVQRREIAKPAMILGPSERFNQLLREDYDVDAARLEVLRHPVLGDSTDRPMKAPEGPIQLLAVMRISVRKGLEQLIELSRRLDDLKGKVRLTIVGGASLWSDYRGHLSRLNPNIAEYGGEMPHGKMPELYGNSDVLLVPSLYEPGSLVVGEALSHGLGIIASSEVGPSEVLSSDCCRQFPAGDVGAFERCVREAVTALSNDRISPRIRAAEQARQLFSPDVICDRFADLLENAMPPSSIKNSKQDSATVAA